MKYFRTVLAVTRFEKVAQRKGGKSKCLTVCTGIAVRSVCASLLCTPRASSRCFLFRNKQVHQVQRIFLSGARLAAVHMRASVCVYFLRDIGTTGVFSAHIRTFIHIYAYVYPRIFPRNITKLQPSDKRPNHLSLSQNYYYYPSCRYPYAGRAVFTDGGFVLVPSAIPSAFKFAFGNDVKQIVNFFSVPRVLSRYTALENGTRGAGAGEGKRSFFTLTHT